MKRCGCDAALSIIHSRALGGPGDIPVQYVILTYNVKMNKSIGTYSF